MCKLIIEQDGYNRVELEFDDMVEAGLQGEYVMGHAKVGTKVSVVCEVKEEEEGE